ncbi:hypothetical protein TNCV_1576201 [Trichonephila clavipes]|nr:hypothetical protein TNCV_1576201 [Trichonephila clavipes]
MATTTVRSHTVRFLWVNLKAVVDREVRLNGLSYSSASSFYFGEHCAPATTATAGSDVVQSGRPIFDDFFQHLWPYIDNNTTNIVFQMVKRLWLIRIDQ